MFKTCPKCGQGWDGRSVFLSDADIELVGYQPHFEDLTTGLFMFNHACGTTFALRVGSFSDMLDGPVFNDRLTGTGVCPGYCNNKTNLKPCPAKCECAYVRDLLGVIRRKLRKDGVDDDD